MPYSICKVPAMFQVLGYMVYTPSLILKMNSTLHT